VTEKTGITCSGQNRIQDRFGAGRRCAVGQDLGRLLERFVLVDADEGRFGTSVPGHDHMFAAECDIVEQAREFGPEPSDGNGLRHGPVVQDVYIQLRDMVKMTTK